MLEFWNSESVQSIDSDNEDFKGIINQLNKDWMCVEEYLDDADDEVKKYLYDYSGKWHREELKTAADIVDYNDRVYGLYLHTRVLSGEETYASALEKYLEYYKACLEKYDKEGAKGQEEQHFLNNGPMLMLNFIKKIPDCERNREIISYLISTTKENLFNKYIDFPSVFINDVLAKWCSKTLEYFTSRKEKEEWILNLIVRRQLPTYLHSVMVSMLAGEFAESILRNVPGYFDALPVKEDIPEYLRHCGLFHDVGKTRIADIINLQGRKLDEDEFEAIRKHPDYGTIFLENDEDLKIYHDVAVGHHRFYDGTGGYPDYYIPGKSPYQSAVDIITVCDCLDAATDCYGRNYKSAKTTEEIFSELKKFAGVRYNPVLVDLISTDTLLKDRIENLLGPGRGEIMYEAYHKTFE
jgi:HD-GYP domain-containing protein (c-di-GMP phosphodiesterase class II)